MKRNPILQTLSREHHTALTLAKACERAAISGDVALVKQTYQLVISVFSNKLEPHLQTEEVTLLPLLHNKTTQLLATCALANHQQLRGLIHALRLNDAEALDNFGKCLSAHVWFEERELFPVLESLL